MHENELLMIQPNDNVAVALRALSKGSECSVGGKNIILKDDIPAAHKVALTEIGKDENVIKYGLPIGHAISPIHMGEHVHIHNMTTNLEGILEYQYHPEPDLWKNFMPEEEAYFDGYLREDGRAGTRNEIWIVPTVGCVNQTAKILAERAAKKYAGRVDGVQALIHNAGCSQLGDDMLMTQKGINWNDFPTYQKRGSCCIKEDYADKENGSLRTHWIIDKEIPMFKGEDRDYVDKLIYVGE